MDIDVYQQYFAAEGSFSGVRRRGAAVMLTAASGGGEIRYTLTVSFFPHKDAEDFRICKSRLSISALFCRTGYKLVVIKGNAESLGDLGADLTASAAVLSAYCNDLIHKTPLKHVMRSLWNNLLKACLYLRKL